MSDSDSDFEVPPRKRYRCTYADIVAAVQKSATDQGAPTSVTPRPTPAVPTPSVPEPPAPAPSLTPALDQAQTSLELLNKEEKSHLAFYTSRIVVMKGVMNQRAQALSKAATIASVMGLAKEQSVRNNALKEQIDNILASNKSTRGDGYDLHFKNVEELQKVQMELAGVMDAATSETMSALSNDWSHQEGSVIVDADGQDVSVQQSNTARNQGLMVLLVGQPLRD